MAHDSDEPDEPNESGALRTILADLFETIADMDDRNQRRRSGTGTARSDNARFDYGFSVGIGPGTATEREDSGTDTGDAGVTPAAGEGDHAATVHSIDESCVVTLDLPDADPRELSAGVDAGARMLVIADDERVIERVELPHGNLDVRDASFNNGILDVRLQPQGETDE